MFIWRAWRALDWALAQFLGVLILIYQLGIRPWLGPRCRFEPTCSCYGREALALHGGVRGSWLTARRLIRCRPGGPFGYDPVPPPILRVPPAPTDPSQD